MEEMHRNHKEPAWGWVGVLLSLLDGFPQTRARKPAARRSEATVVTPWSHRSPNGWSA